MAKKQSSDGLSKRQLRKEEIKKKERQQRVFTIGALSLAALVVLALIIVPSIQKAINPAGDFTKITPIAYANANGTTMGDPNAKVKIDLFEDFQCHACKVYGDEVESQVINQIVDAGLAYYVFHQYPFLDDDSSIKESDRTALASECAAAQNQFWNFKKLLFANQTGINGQFNDERILAFAKSLNLDSTAFEQCLNSGEFAAKIDEGLKLGGEMGVKGTPSVFVNGVEVAPGKVPTFAEIMALVQKAAAESN